MLHEPTEPLALVGAQRGQQPGRLNHRRRAALVAQQRRPALRVALDPNLEQITERIEHRAARQGSEPGRTHEFGWGLREASDERWVDAHPAVA